LGMLLAVPTVALAADLLTEAELSSDINLRTEVAPNATENFDIKVWARGNINNNTNVTGVATITNAYTMGSTGAITANTGSGSTTTVTFAKNHNYGNDGETCPASVPTQATGVTGRGCASDPFIVPATLSVGAVDAGKTGTLTVGAVGSNALGTTSTATCSTSSTANDPGSTPDATDCTRDQGFVEVVDPNTAPSVPGVPSGTSPNQGAFVLNWTASTDAQSNPITYTLQHKDADDASFSNVATGITGNLYRFGLDGPDADTNPDNPVEGEGTWTYRVSASDGSLSSAFSAASSAIVVDDTNPNAPSAAADRDPDYNPTGTDNDWFLNTVTVSFTDNGDPGLPDGSDGSGVDLSTLSGPVIKNTSGPHTVSDTVDDNAGNTSAQGSLTVQVDADRPTVDLTCPTGSVVQGSTASASWTANDDHSGLATDASGSISPLNTSAIGPQTATAPAGTAEDNVGLQSLVDTCSYNVIYNWSGFFSPVDDLPTLNLVKGGSSVPMKFNLGGNQGMGILAAGYPKSISIPCDSTAELDALETVATAGSSGLNFDSTTNQYNYIWKTDKAWTSGCRQVEVKLIDGTSHRANFKFSK
jgi:hypothetical protein